MCPLPPGTIMCPNASASSTASLHQAGPRPRGSHVLLPAPLAAHLLPLLIRGHCPRLLAEVQVERVRPLRQAVVVVGGASQQVQLCALIDTSLGDDALAILLADVYLGAACGVGEQGMQEDVWMMEGGGGSGRKMPLACVSHCMVRVLAWCRSLNW